MSCCKNRSDESGLKMRCWGWRGGSTQARNRKSWPDGTFANSFYFLCMLIEAVRQDSKKICERESRTKEENVRGEA